MGQQAGQFTGEDKHVVGHGIKQRLLAQSITGQQQMAVVAIIDREGEHALQTIDKRIAKLFVEVDQRFRVGFCREAMAFFLQFPPQFQMIVDFTI